MKLKSPSTRVATPQKYHLRASSKLILMFVLGAFSTIVIADCVDFSEKRHKQAAAALAKNPPKFSELGLPELPNLTIDAAKSSGDPKCDPPEKRKSFTYKTNMSRLDFYKVIFPYMKPWNTWINPGGGNSHNFYLSSGTEIRLRCPNNCKEEDYNTQGNITEVLVTRHSNPPASLSTDGPGWNWAPEDLAKGSGKPAAGRADKERPDSASTTSGASNNSSDKSNGSSTNSENPPSSDSAPASNTVDDTLNKAKKLKDLLKF